MDLFSIESESDESFADSISALGIFNKLNASHIFPSGSRLLLVKKQPDLYPFFPMLVIPGYSSLIVPNDFVMHLIRKSHDI